MIPKLIHQMAPSTTLTPEELRLKNHNIRLMQGWEFRLWDNDHQVRLVNENFPEYRKTFDGITKGVIRADISRCVALYLYGGFYLDTDYKMLRPIDEALLEHPVILPVSGTEADRHLVCNSVLASEPNHPFWKAFIASVFANPALAALEEGMIEKTTGPVGLSQFYLRNRAIYPEIYLAPKRLFHPRIGNMGLSYDKSYPSYGVHFCWGSWRSKSPVRKLKNLATRKWTSL